MQAIVYISQVSNEHVAVGQVGRHPGQGLPCAVMEHFRMGTLKKIQCYEQLEANTSITIEGKVAMCRKEHSRIYGMNRCLQPSLKIEDRQIKKL